MIWITFYYNDYLCIMCIIHIGGNHEQIPKKKYKHEN